MSVIICNKEATALGEKISKKTGSSIARAENIIYNNNELQVVIKDLDSITAAISILHIFDGGSANDSLFSLLQTIEAAYNITGAELDLILPYFLYARHDRRFSAHHSFGMNNLARIINNMPVKRLQVCDIHNPDNLDLFSAETNNILPRKLINELTQDKLVVLPDQGAKTRYKIKAAKIAYCQKSRIDDQIELSMSQDVVGQDCIIIDDMIDSGQTMLKTADMLKNKGASKVEAYATHALLNNDFVQKYLASGISKLYVTNSIFHQQMMPGIEVLDIADLIVESM